MTAAVSPMRVLVVDDCTDTATTLAMLLKHFGHEASIATGGEAALQQAPIFRPDAMFIDLAVPQIDGLNVAKRLRSTSEFAKTPLVAVSGYVGDKSGTSREVSLFERSAAEELRRWLNLHLCRVGPVFEASPGCFTFFVYSRRLELAELIGQHGRYRVDG